MKKPIKRKAKARPIKHAVSWWCSTCSSMHLLSADCLPQCAACSQHHADSIACAAVVPDAERRPPIPSLAEIEAEFEHARLAYEAYAKSGARTAVTMASEPDVTRVHITTVCEPRESKH